MIDRSDEPRDDESRGFFVGQNRACRTGEFFKGWRRKSGLVTLTNGSSNGDGLDEECLTVDIHLTESAGSLCLATATLSQSGESQSRTPTGGITRP